jgi:guanylate kinase
MTTITRDIKVHPDQSDAAADCVVIDAGWMRIELSDSEAVTIFLTEPQMRELSARLLAKARDWQESAASVSV